MTPEEILQILYVALKNGGSSLTTKKLGFEKVTKTEKDFIQELLKQGLLEKNNRNYQVTEKGQKFFNSNAEEHQIQELKEGPLKTFLELVEAKKGKPFTAKQLEKIDSTVVHQASENGYVDNIKKNTFALSNEGNIFLTAKLPLNEALQKVSQTITSLDKALGNFAQQLQKSKQPNLPELDSIYNDVDNNIATIKDELHTKLKELRQKAETVGIASVLHAKIEHVQNEVCNKLAKVEETTQVSLENYQKIVATEQQRFLEMHESLLQESNKLQKDQQQLVKLLGTLQASKVSISASATTSVVKPEAVPQKVEAVPQKVDERELIAAMKREYDDLTKTALSKVIKLPVLYHALKDQYPKLSIEIFKKVMLQLCDDVVVDLHSVNDKSGLDYPELSINTLFGDLYYVSWR